MNRFKRRIKDSLLLSFFHKLATINSISLNQGKNMLMKTLQNRTPSQDPLKPQDDPGQTNPKLPDIDDPGQPNNPEQPQDPSKPGIQPNPDEKPNVL